MSHGSHVVLNLNASCKRYPRVTLTRSSEIENRIEKGSSVGKQLRKYKEISENGSGKQIWRIIQEVGKLIGQAS
jgi:hypothetical protein